MLLFAALLPQNVLLEEWRADDLQYVRNLNSEMDLRHVVSHKHVVAHGEKFQTRYIRGVGVRFQKTQNHLRKSRCSRDRTSISTCSCRAQELNTQYMARVIWFRVSPAQWSHMHHHESCVEVGCGRDDQALLVLETRELPRVLKFGTRY